jgi:uncharacterized membrane protein YkvA (DUF1232 family)
MFNELKQRARALKRETLALYYAYRDPRTPLIAQLWALLVLLYALSPIDLIPDFIPVLGYLDDVILVPAGIALAIRLIPAEVMEAARLTAAQAEGRPNRLGRVGAVFIIIIWLLISIGLAHLILNRMRGL